MRRRLESPATIISVAQEDRDPFDEWSYKSNMSNFAALINMTKAAIAVGFLKMPYHMSQSGIIWSTLITVVSLILSLFAARAQIRVQNKVAEDKEKNYICFPDVIKVLLDNGPTWCSKSSRYVKQLIVIFIILFHITICSIYVNIMSYKSVFFFGSRNQWREMVEVSLIVPLVFVCFLIRKMKHVTYISACGDALLIITLIFIFYLIGNDEDERSLKRDYLSLNGTKCLSLFGTTLFATHNFGVLTLVHAHMRENQDFIKPTGVLNQSYAVIFIFMAVAGLQSCFKLASVADLPYGSDGLDRIFRTVLRVLYSIIIFLSIPIHFQVCAEFTGHYYFYRLPEGYPIMIIDYIVRLLLIISIVIMALFVPPLAGFYPLFGDIVVALGGVCLPALVEFIYTWQSEETKWLKFQTMCIDVGIMVVGIQLFILGILNNTYFHDSGKQLNFEELALL